MSVVAKGAAFTNHAVVDALKHARSRPAFRALAWLLRKLRSELWFVALVAFVFATYRFAVSAGTNPWPFYMNYHDLQAEGFLKGQLNLALDPAPELLRAENPYDRVNSRYWALDTSYYDGKYFMYWGPVPALLQAAAKGLLQLRRPLGDSYLMFFFLCLGFLGGALLIRRVAARLFPGQPRWLLALGMLAFAFVNPTLHCATSPGTYQVSIIGAQAWAMLGLLFAFDAVWYAGAGRARYFRLVAAGSCFALAIGTRITLAPALALVMLFTLWADWAASERRFRRALAVALCLGVPVALGSFGLLLYNYLRFDHWFEFGSKLQLSGFPTLFFDLDFVPLNFWSYTVRPWIASCEFPYLFQIWNPPPDFPDGFPVPKSYYSPEPVVGFLLAVPLCWLAPLAFWFAPFRRAGATRHSRAYTFCVWSFASCASLTVVIALGAYGSTMRYLSDIAFGLVLLSLLAVFALRSHRLAAHAPRLISSLCGLLALATALIGVLLGYQGYNGHFRNYNPRLHAKIVETLSFCPEAEPRWVPAVVEPGGYRPRKW